MSRRTLVGSWLALAALALAPAHAQPAADANVVRVDPARRLKPVSPHLTGVCLEDVNHEVYGGIDSQMVFGESFQEPAPVELGDLRGFGGAWSVTGGEVRGDASDGGKLLAAVGANCGAMGVEVYVEPGAPSDANAGVVVGVSDAGVGADRFAGWEVSVNPAARTLRLGRHDNDFRLVRDTPADVAAGRWVALAARFDAGRVEVDVDGKTVLRHEGMALPRPGTHVGLRTWRAAARFRNAWVEEGGQRRAFTLAPPSGGAVSGMWRAFARDGAEGDAALVDSQPFVGTQSQQLRLTRGTGTFGVENRGLNRQGMRFVAAKSYEGRFWARADQPVDAVVALASADGATVHARQTVRIEGTDWKRYDFELTPNADEPNGRFELALTSAGVADVGYVLLQPGAWGRFEGLPVRVDVGALLRSSGVGAMRYGGLMVNVDGYRWKHMLGDRDRRPPYKGFWYEHSSNGWGIGEFLDLCAALRVPAVPAFNTGESPQDLLDFVEYANGPADSPWGARRAAAGRREPYNVRHVQIGNEEKIDLAYYAKFAPIAEALWAKHPDLILVVGDWSYGEIADPMRLTNADSRIADMRGHEAILKLAQKHGKQVWFDLHYWSERPAAGGARYSHGSLMRALDSLADGADYKVAVFELNANRHDQGRAVANAQFYVYAMNDGRFPLVASANALQVDGQNDDGWDQGLIFMNPAKAWLQPPGLALKLFAEHYQPTLIACEAQVDGVLETAATVSDDGRETVLRAVNPTDVPIVARVEVQVWAGAPAEVTTLAADANATNTADAPTRVAPVTTQGLSGPDGRHAFPPQSVTLIRWRRGDGQ